eukprot:XP_001693764.1 predicted protein [Chlamydomonas reinhardtii]
MAPNKVDLVAARAASKLAQLQARGIIAAPAESASTAQPNSCQTAIPGVPVLSNAAPNTKQYVRQCVVVPAYCTLEEIATRSGVLALREVPLPLPPLPIVQPQRPASGTASTGTIGDLDSCSLASFDSHIGVYSIDGSRAWLAAADSNCSTPYTACTAETPSSSLTHCGFDACYAGEQPCPAYLAAGHGAVPPVPPGFERLMPMAGAAAAALYEDASDDDLLPMPLRTAVLPSVAAAANPATGAGLQASRQAQQAAGVQFYYQAGSGYHRMGAAAAAASDCQAAEAPHHGEHQSTAMQLQQLQRARQLQQQGLLRAVSLPLPPALAPMPLMFGPSRGTAITAAIRRGLGAAFERQPELFRQLYGFELHWWAGIRGRPVGEDDLLRVMAFKDYAVVLVRTDPYAAPALAPPPPTLNAKRPTSAVAAQRQLMQQRRRRRLALNAPMSALLGQRVHGNAVVIRLWVDFASNHAANASSLSSVSSGSSCWVPPEDRILLAPVSVTSLRNELLNAETVAWHLQQSDAMMSEMRLGPERQAGWLLRLPRTPLDMRGDPDTIAALRLATEAAGLPPMAPGKAAAMLAAAAEAACKAAAEDEEGGAGSDALGASAVSVPGVPQELAPLLRCVRCTSPWCHPGRRGAALLCPFGHMWRHLDPVAPLMASNQGAYEPSPTVAASMAPPVLNAARPAALQAAAAAPPYPGTSAAAGSATGGPVQVAAPAAAGGAGLQALLQPVSALVAEPCESLVSYLSDPDTWCGPLTDLVAAAVEGGMDGAALAAAVATSGSAAEHSTAGSLACNSNTAAQAEVDDHDQPGEAGAAKPQEDEREAMYAAATAAVRPEGWPFYLGFCAQGPQCTRCHSGHELRLATVVQQLKSAVLKKKPAGPTNRARNVGQLAPSKRAAAVAAAVAAAAAAGKGIATRSGFAALEVEEAPARDTDSDMSDWEGEPEREQPIEPAPAADAEDEPAAASRAAATAATSYVRAVTAAVAAVEVPASTASASAPDPAALPSARLSEPLPPAMPAPAPAPGIRSWAAIAAKPPPEPELDDEEWYGEDQEQEEEAPQPAAAVPISFCGQWAVMRMPGRGLKKAAPAAAAPTPKPAADPVVEQPEVSKEDDAGESVLAPAVQDAAEVCHVPPAPSTPPAATGSSGVDAEMSGSESRASASAGGVVAEVGDSDAFEAVVAAAVAAGKFNWADEAEQEEQELAAAAEAEAEEKVCRVEQQRRELEAEVAVGWQQAESPKRWRKEERQEEAVNVVARQELRPEIRAPPPAIPPPPPHQRPKPAATAITYTSTTSSTAAAQRTGDMPCVSFAAALAAAAAAQRARDGLPAESDGEIEELDEDEDASDELDSDEEQPTSKAATCNALSNGFEPAPAPGTTISTTIATSTRADAENAPAAQPHTQQQRGEAVAAEPMYEAPRYHAPPQYTQPTQQQPHFYQQQAIGYMAMPGGGGYVALMAPTSLAPMQVPQMPIAVPLGGGGGGSAGGSGDGAGGLGQAGVQGPPSWQLPPQAGWPAGSQVTWVPVIQPPPQQGVFGALPAMPGAGTYGFMPSVYGATPPMQPTYQAPAYHSGYQPSYVQAQQPTQAQPYMPHHVAQQTQPKAQLPYFMQPRTDARSGRLKDKLAAAAAGTTMAATYVQPAPAAGAEDEGDVDDLLHLLVPESR